MIIKAAKRIFNSDKTCRSYSDLNFGVTFLEHSVFDTHAHCNVGMMSTKMLVSIVQLYIIILYYNTIIVAISIWLQ